MKKIVFFGAGNITQSIILGLISSGHNKENILSVSYTHLTLPTTPYV